ncbi:hypothetical protein GIB67_024181 [Kingdonia uniflora]|uniref:Uncharacterized protein n=1 Tax=Kingdonia uniflora TaxID=39325 RepID=A0A7J7LZD1_9MAGN|nr:hypothetical protein GIB67_024181 [Kingdonia uniflora]
MRRLLKKNKVFQFLVGLNPEFEYARVHLLDRTPFPNLEEDYAYCLSDQIRRFTLPSIIATPPDISAMAAQFPRQLLSIAPGFLPLPDRQSTSGQQHLKKCDHYGKWEHLKATCHSLHGRPPAPQQWPINSQLTANMVNNAPVQDSSPFDSLTQEEIRRFRQLLLHLSCTDFLLCSHRI